jgi:5-methylcytosine-specific restriction endonuclease McrA
MTKAATDYSKITLGDLKVQYSTSDYHAKIRGHARSVFKQKGVSACYLCAYTSHIDICHVIEIRSFNENTIISDVNKIENLIPLCKNCHWEFDNNKLDEENAKIMKKLVLKVKGFYAKSN